MKLLKKLYHRAINDMIFLFIEIPVLVAAVGAGAFIIKFRGNGLPETTGKWGDFGNYLTGVLSVINVYVFIVFALVIYNYQIKRDRKALEREADVKDFQRAIEGPILTVKTDDKNGKEIWEITNIGKGPALNLHACYKNDYASPWIPPLVNCYSLESGDSVKLDWMDAPHVIGLHYNDIFSTAFVTIISDGIAQVKPYDEKFNEVTINNQAYTRKDIDEMLSLEAQRLTVVRTRMPGANT